MTASAKRFRIEQENKISGRKKMAMKKKPVTGMKDILPKEMAIRDYCNALIKET